MTTARPPLPPLQFDLEPFLDALCERLAERSCGREDDPSPYLAGWSAAACYLGIAASTLKRIPGLPRRKIGGTVLFRRDELDLWADSHYCGPRHLKRPTARTGRTATG